MAYKHKITFLCFLLASFQINHATFGNERVHIRVHIPEEHHSSKQVIVHDDHGDGDGGGYGHGSDFGGGGFAKHLHGGFVEQLNNHNNNDGGGGQGHGGYGLGGGHWGGGGSDHGSGGDHGGGGDYGGGGDHGHGGYEESGGGQWGGGGGGHGEGGTGGNSAGYNSFADEYHGGLGGGYDHGLANGGGGGFEYTQQGGGTIGNHASFAGGNNDGYSYSFSSDGSKHDSFGGGNGGGDSYNIGHEGGGGYDSYSGLGNAGGHGGFQGDSYINAIGAGHGGGSSAKYEFESEEKIMEDAFTTRIPSPNDDDADFPDHPTVSNVYWPHMHGVKTYAVNLFCGTKTIDQTKTSEYVDPKSDNKNIVATTTLETPYLVTNENNEMHDTEMNTTELLNNFNDNEGQPEVVDAVQNFPATIEPTVNTMTVKYYARQMVKPNGKLTNDRLQHILTSLLEKLGLPGFFRMNQLIEAKRRLFVDDEESVTPWIKCVGYKMLCVLGFYDISQSEE